MKISVVIPARNEEARLGAQLDALLAQDWEGTWDVLVVDNGSTDGTAELVHAYERRSPRIRYLLATEVPDQSFAANAGVAATDADAVVFCDGDDIVAPGWLRAMAEGLDSHLVVTGPNELDLLNPPWLADSRGRSIEGPVGSFAGIFPLVRGNSYGVRREVWAVTGPLKESYFPVADQEFSLRCWLCGIDVVGLPEAVVHYRYRDTAGALATGFRLRLTSARDRPIVEGGRQADPAEVLGLEIVAHAGGETPDIVHAWRSSSLDLDCREPVRTGGRLLPRTSRHALI